MQRQKSLCWTTAGQRRGYPLDGNAPGWGPFRLTAASQSISATIGTIQATDQLIDPSALDRDNLNITIPPGFAFADLTTTNIENFKFFLNGANGALSFDFNNGGNTQTGVKTVIVSGTIATPGNFFVRNFADSGAKVLDASGVTTPGALGGVGSGAFLALGATNPAVTMTGGAGNDTLIGGDGADLISGNDVIDQLTVMAVWTPLMMLAGLTS